MNTGADTAMEAYKEGLDYIRQLMQRFEHMKSFEWLKKWIVIAMDRAERQIDGMHQLQCDRLISIKFNFSSIST